MCNQEILSLDGDWKLAAYKYVPDRKEGLPDTEALDWMDAAVPGAVHYDLVKSGKLENPFASTQAAHAAEWVAQTDWIYTRKFELEQELSDVDAFALRFEGIDTYADIWLNDRLLGQTANAYRSYEFEVDASMLRAGDNRLIVHVKNHFRMTEGKADEAKRRLQVSRNPTAYRGKSLIRRYQRNFYSNSSLLNLGTGVLGIGIHKPVRLIAYPKLRIEESYFSVQQLITSQADVRVEVKLNRSLSEAGKALTVEAVLQQPDMLQPAAIQSAAVTGGETDLRLTVQEPRLWWPRGYGGQPLYRLTLRLYDGTTLLHEIEKQVGIKQVEIIRELPNGRKTFYLQVNGVKIHARGSNLIPVDYLKVHDTWDVYERLFRLMQASHHNTLRIWGGGAVETDKFYDRCDELGILIWQDFFLHSNTYPDYDPEFVEEFREESVELVKRIRDRASLGVLCGGNEQMEGWDEWNWKSDLDRFYGEPLIQELLPEIAAAYCPHIPYVVNSPHGGKWAQSAVEGDMHNWGNFYNATKDPQFVTETCWNLDSYSRPETLKACMGLDVEQFNERGWHHKWKELTSHELHTKFPFSDYHHAATLKDYLRSLEIEHAQADYHALSYLRLRSSSCSGILYWSLNKGGPLFGFGCVDYKGIPMMSYYTLKRVLSDVLVGIHRYMDDIHVIASNLTREPIQGQIRVTHMNADGRVIKLWQQPVTVASDETRRVFTLESYYREILDRTNEVIHMQWIVGDTIVSDDTLFFCTLSEFEPIPNPIRIKVLKTDRTDAWTLEIEGESVSKLLMLEGSHKMLCSDNYFTLAPGTKKQIDVEILERTGDEEALRLTVSSLDVPGEIVLELK